MPALLSLSSVSFPWCFSPNEGMTLPTLPQCPSHPRPSLRHLPAWNSLHPFNFLSFCTWSWASQTLQDFVQMLLLLGAVPRFLPNQVTSVFWAIPCQTWHHYHGYCHQLTFTEHSLCACFILLTPFMRLWYWYHGHLHFIGEETRSRLVEYLAPGNSAVYSSSFCRHPPQCSTGDSPWQSQIPPLVFLRLYKENLKTCMKRCGISWKIVAGQEG